MHLRYVCRTLRTYGLKDISIPNFDVGTFDDEVVQTVCNLRCFEFPASNYNRYQHENLALKYLFARTQSGRVNGHHITRAITNSVENIIKEMPELEPRRDEFVYGLCWCAIQISAAPTVHALLNTFYEIPKRTDNCRVTPLDNAFAAAAYLAITPLLQRLLSKVDPQNSISDFGTPLNSAIAGGNHLVVELLLSHAFTVSEHSYPRFLSKDHSSTIQILADQTPEPTAGTFRAAILRATAIGDFDTVVHYVQCLKHLPPDMKTRQKWDVPLQNWSATANDSTGFQCLYNCILYVAADHGYQNLVRYAIKNGANVNCRPAWSLLRGVVSKRNAFSPLATAAKRGHLAIVRFLLNQGATPTREALKQAARVGWFDVTQTLLDAGVNLWPIKGTPENGFIGTLDCGFNDFQEIVKRGHVDITRLYLHTAGGLNKSTDKTMKKHAAAAYRIAQQEDKREILELMEQYVYNGETGKGWLRMEYM